MPSPGSASLALLIAKIVVSVGFVLLGTAAAERLGPRLGGLLAATPQMAVVSLIFFAIEQGLTVPLAYAVDIAYVVLVARLTRPEPPENALATPVAGG